MNLAILLIPPILLLLLEVIRQVFGLSWHHHRWWYAVLLAVTITGMILFARRVTKVVERVHAQEAHQTQELLALHQSSLAIASDLRLDGVLQRVVNESSALIGSRYGAISYHRDGQVLESFVTHGVSEQERRLIGMPPVGHGVLGIPITSGQTLSIADIRSHPRSVGFPPNHPLMKQLLAVPIVTNLGIVGNLYLSDRADDAPFTDDDEASLKRFAALAAIAIENAVLHNQIEVLAITNERDRIAREMHDSLSQILAYVNTKSQAALTYLKRENPEAARLQIEQLAAAARDAYVDVREGIFALRSAGQRGQGTSVVESLRVYVSQWQLQHGISATFTSDTPDVLGDLAPLAEVHLLRLVQEALSNVRKHADASEVEVCVKRRGKHWQIAVRDNGRGFDPDVKYRGELPRFGLSSMRERAEASGGTFDIDSTVGLGSCILVTLPVVTD